MIQAFADGETRGFLHKPETPLPRLALALTHGAGSNCRAPLLVSVAEEFAAAGFLVLRFDLPFRQARAGGPPRPGDAARDRQGMRQAAASLERLAGSSIFLGGHSYGGRQSTMLAAEDPTATRGLLLLSYPLHPPRQPANLRTAHFPKLSAPALFAYGSRDPFGSLDEMRAALALIPAPTKLLEIEGAGHDLKHVGIAKIIVEQFKSFMF